MQCDYYAHYGTAPVTAWVFRKDLNKAMKPLIGSHHKVFLFNPKDETDKYKKTQDALDWCKIEKDRIFKKDVTDAFNKFDKDGSGTIDKYELADLSLALGHELTDYEIDTALKDLDLNGDGVIDLTEFSRWYFTGMKPYSGAKRTMLLAGT